MDIPRILFLIFGTPLIIVLGLVLSVFIFYGIIRLLRRFRSRQFPLFVAERYLFGKTQNKSLAATIWHAFKGLFPRRKKQQDAPTQNAINVITSISVFAIMVVTASLILVLSVFNGFQEVIETRYTSFDPDLRVIPAKGKTFAASDSLEKAILQHPDILTLAPTIEGKAMVSYYDRQQMGIIKGVSKRALEVDRLDELVYDGDYSFQSPEGYPTGVLGGTIAYFLNAHISDKETPVSVWTATESGDPLRNPEGAFNTMAFFPSGYFKVQLEYDSKYILVDIDSAAKFFGYGDNISAYEVKINDFDRSNEVAASLQAQLGQDFKVLTWFDLHSTLFKVMENEKVVAYLILTLMMLIAGVNIIGGLSMIVVEKTRDIGILGSMGASRKMIQRIFITEGFLVGAIGGTAGMISAFLFGFVHETLGLIPLAGGESYNDLEFFPFEMHVQDFGLIFITVFGLSILAAIFPSRKAAQTVIVDALRK